LGTRGLATCLPLQVESRILHLESSEHDHDHEHEDEDEHEDEAGIVDLTSDL
jgi:hypothetical protein